MEIKMLNANTELLRTFESIVRNPKKWKGWSCIHLQDSSLRTFKFAIELLFEMEKNLQYFLQSKEGLLFLGGFEDVFVFCKGETRNDLLKLGHCICSFINPEEAENLDFDVYDLFFENDEFVDSVVKQSSLFDPWNSTLFCYDRTKDTHLSRISSERNDNTLKNQVRPDSTRVLLIEDDPTSRWIYRKYLHGECILQTASNMGTAFASYTHTQPDIVFLDIGLPDGSGYAFLEWAIRSDPGAHVVICSINRDSENKQRAIDYGAKGFITKPFKKESLMKYIDDCPKLH